MSTKMKYEKKLEVTNTTDHSPCRMSCIFQPGPTPCTAARTQNVPEWSSSHRDWTTGLCSAPAMHSESGSTAIYIKGLYVVQTHPPPPDDIFPYIQQYAKIDYHAPF